MGATTAPARRLESRGNTKSGERTATPIVVGNCMSWRLTLNLPELPDQLALSLEVGDCWLWMGRKDKHGYGTVWWENRRQLVHRLVWQMLVGTIPDGLQIDHLCRVRSCTNPDHLDVVTHTTNVRRSPFYAGSHCRKGHLYDVANTYWRGDRRECRACKRERRRRWRLRQKGEG